MSLTEKMAVKIGSNAKLLLSVDEDKEQIVIYGAISLLQMVFVILWIIAFVLLFVVLYEALLFSGAISVLRKYSDLHYIKYIESISLGVLWQAITLTKIRTSLLNKVDFVLKYIIRGGE